MLLALSPQNFLFSTNFSTFLLKTKPHASFWFEIGHDPLCAPKFWCATLTSFSGQC